MSRGTALLTRTWLPEALRLTFRGGVLFDHDGTLVDTMGVWRTAEEAISLALGAPWTPDLHDLYAGYSVVDTSRMIAAAAGRPLDVEYAYTMMLDRFRYELASGHATAFPGVVDLLRGLNEAGVPIAVVSNSPSEAVEASLVATGLRPWVDLVVSDGDYSFLRPKPHPDLYQHACNLLDVDPFRSVGVEDTAGGAASARAANLLTALVPTAAQGIAADHRLTRYDTGDMLELLVRAASR
jgi:HAD superfamily hydrolase (TIGR01509 family)